MPFLLFYWVLQRASATMASLSGYIVPLISLLGGVILLDERIELGIVVGGALILVGRGAHRPSRAACRRPQLTWNRPAFQSPAGFVQSAGDQRPTSAPDPAIPRSSQGKPQGQSRTMSVSRKIGVLLIGVPLLGAGDRPHPPSRAGSLVILAALAVLSLEFAWAERWSRQIRDGFRTVFEKITGRR